MHQGFRQHLATDPATNPQLARRRARLQLFAWFLLGTLAIGFAIGQSVWEHKRHFTHVNVQLANHVSDRALIAETALEGFAAFAMSLKTLRHTTAAEYARSLIARYPFLYKFEVAERTPHSARESLEQRLADIYPGFRISRFDYDNQRRWSDAPVADDYYPIIFQWPEFDDERRIVGLDLYSSEVLIDAMQRSFRRGMPVASKPFVLAENANGYVIHRAVHEELPATVGPFMAERYALLALRSDRMFGELPKLHPEFTVILSYPDNPASSAAKHPIMSAAPNPVSMIERHLLPEFSQTQSLAASVPSQPFVLETRYQMTWEDLNLPLILGVLAMMFFGPWLSKRFAVDYFEDQLAGMGREGTLYQMANFDSLTGVANRHRLLEQTELAVLRAQRDSSRFCLLFIDINKFKSINDELGHAAGDVVLVAFSHRLGDLLRADEILGRLGGDEFIVLINDNTAAHDLEALIGRIKHESTSQIDYKGQNIPITVSVGYACYPKDGNNISSLMEVADGRMYKDKLDSPNIAETE